MVLVLAWLGGPASRARSGAPHRSCCCFAFLSAPSGLRLPLLCFRPFFWPPPLLLYFRFFRPRVPLALPLCGCPPSVIYGYTDRPNTIYIIRMPQNLPTFNKIGKNSISDHKLIFLASEKSARCKKTSYKDPQSTKTPFTALVCTKKCHSSSKIGQLHQNTKSSKMFM